MRAIVLVVTVLFIAGIAFGAGLELTADLFYYFGNKN